MSRVCSMRAQPQRLVSRCPTQATRLSAHHTARRSSSVRVAASAASPTSVAETAAAPIITLTDKALAHLKKLRAESSSSQEMLLRVGVKEGGCSGMSYVMDFAEPSDVTENDTIIPYDGGSFQLVTDPKSLLYLFGMELDYSSALINGGFKFENPNASKTCGCGKSFGVPGGPAAVEKAEGEACS